MKRKCCFCESHDVSREHILPQWLQEELGISKKLFVSKEEASGGIIREYPFDTNNYITKRVCKECNNGWMSVLEDDTKPILNSIFQGKISQINEEQKSILSRWVLKTAMVSLLPSENTSVRIPQHHIDSIKIGIIPDDIFIFYSLCTIIGEVEPFAIKVKHNWNHFPYVIEEKIQQRINDNGYKHGLYLSNCCFYVVYKPALPKWKIAVPREYFSLLSGRRDDITWLKTVKTNLPQKTKSDILMERYLETIMLLSNEIDYVCELRKTNEEVFTNDTTGIRKRNTIVKIKRNDPCNCGSRKKYKKCCINFT